MCLSAGSQTGLGLLPLPSDLAFLLFEDFSLKALSSQCPRWGPVFPWERQQGSLARAWPQDCGHCRFQQRKKEKNVFFMVFYFSLSLFNSSLPLTNKELGKEFFFKSSLFRILTFLAWVGLRRTRCFLQNKESQFVYQC